MRSVSLPLAVLTAATVVVNASPVPNNAVSLFSRKQGRVEVQAHRGGLGMRSEESLWVCCP